MTSLTFKICWYTYRNTLHHYLVTTYPVYLSETFNPSLDKNLLKYVERVGVKRVYSLSLSTCGLEYPHNYLLYTTTEKELRTPVFIGKEGVENFTDFKNGENFYTTVSFICR